MDFYHFYFIIYFFSLSCNQTFCLMFLSFCTRSSFGSYVSCQTWYGTDSIHLFHLFMLKSKKVVLFCVLERWFALFCAHLMVCCVSDLHSRFPKTAYTVFYTLPLSGCKTRLYIYIYIEMSFSRVDRVVNRWGQYSFYKSFLCLSGLSAYIFPKQNDTLSATHFTFVVFDPFPVLYWKLSLWSPHTLWGFLQSIKTVLISFGTC